MSARHLISDPSDLVLRSLRGLVATHPALDILPSHKVVYNSIHDKAKVSLISGGGAGHEPGAAGFVGQGLLTAAVSGNIFASPSAKQVRAAIKAVPSEAGTILILLNYTGDALNFGLACQQEKADAAGDIGMILVGDDVSIENKPGSIVGRRGLSGITLVYKMLGGASQKGLSFTELMDLGQVITKSMGSIALTLDHCHVPGRLEFAQLPQDTVELGLGLHNEPGFFVISPQPPLSELIGKMLDLLLNSDPNRSFIPHEAADQFVLLVANMGGTSTLEVNAAVDEVLMQLRCRGVKPLRVFSGLFMTSLNSPGISLSLLNLSNIARRTRYDVETLLEYLDAPHGSIAWPGCALHSAQTTEAIREPPNPAERKDVALEVSTGPKTDRPDLTIDAEKLIKALDSAAQTLLQAEPDLTQFDTLLGDGDCGESCVIAAKGILHLLQDGLGSDGKVIQALHTITELIENQMGGTFGAIVAIFLSALANELRKEISGDVSINASLWGKAACAAIDILGDYTPARVGHRTVMDALIPFAETLKESNDLNAAIQACKKGGEGTAFMEAKLGRATYISHNHTVPDPGAMAMVAVAESFRFLGKT